MMRRTQVSVVILVVSSSIVSLLLVWGIVRSRASLSDEARFMNIIESQSVSFRLPIVKFDPPTAFFEPYSGCKCDLSFRDAALERSGREHKISFDLRDESVLFEYSHFESTNLFVAAFPLPGTGMEVHVACGYIDVSEIERVLQFLADCVALYLESSSE